MRYGLTSDGILQVVQGKDDLGDMLKLLDQGVWGEEGVTDEKHKRRA